MVDYRWFEVARFQGFTISRCSRQDSHGLRGPTREMYAGVNIGAANISTQPGQRAVQSFELWVTDVSILNRVMKEIERVKGVISVERVRG